jgi:hypothetical protein
MLCPSVYCRLIEICDGHSRLRRAFRAPELDARELDGTQGGDSQVARDLSVTRPLPFASKCFVRDGLSLEAMCAYGTLRNANQVQPVPAILET